jgi:16S rRNA (guanine966-N2)-methyltransferase
VIRIISGASKGKRLRNVPGPLVRPMPDKLKSALFNILRDEIRGRTVLDGFAGTGSIGLEALSRGAASAVFVEHYAKAASVLRHNIAKCAAEGRSRVVFEEFNRAVIRLSKEKAAFDLVFLDPPYRLLEERNPLKVIRKREILRPGGLIVLRRHFKTRFEGRFFELVRSVTLGDDTLAFYAERT